MEDKRGVTNYIKREDDGKWYVVRCYPYKKGKREHPESWALEQAYQEGVKEVVEWVNSRWAIDPLEWQEQLKKWGIK